MALETKSPSEAEQYAITQAFEEWAARSSATAHRAFHFQQDMTDEGFLYLCDLFLSGGFLIVNVLSLPLPSGKLMREVLVRSIGTPAWTGRSEPPATRILPCPHCSEEGESDPSATDLTCPHCGYCFAV